LGPFGATGRVTAGLVTGSAGLVAGSGRAGGDNLSLLTSFLSAERHVGSERDTTIDLGLGRGTGRVDDVVSFSEETESFGFIAVPALAAASVGLGLYRTVKFCSGLAGFVLGLLSGIICTNVELLGLDGDGSQLEDLLLSRGQGTGHSADFGS